MVNSGDCIVPMGQSWSLKLLIRPVPEKPVTGLWPSSAPVAGASPKGPFFQLPGLLLTTMTHLMLFGSPSTAMGNRSGHSHWPPVALAGPKVLSGVQVFRSVDL